MKNVFLYTIAMFLSTLLMGQSQMTNNGNFQLFTNANMGIFGDFVNNGSFVAQGGTVNFNGAFAQSLGGTQPTAFNSLTINNASTGLILNNNATVATALTFTKGNINASNYSLTLLSTSSPVSGASASSYVIVGNGVGNLGFLAINNIPINTATIFPIGTASYYLPVTINPGTNASNSYSSYVFTPITANSQSNGPGFSNAALAQVLNAVWDITRTSGSGTVSLNLNWASSGNGLEGSSFHGYGTNIGISQFSSGSWQPSIGSGSTAGANATANFSTFTHFSVGQLGVVLPVTLFGFDAMPQDGKVLLSWSMANSQGVDQFEIQRSTNGTDWIGIGSVPAISVNTQQNNYVFTDLNPYLGLNYYRLLIKSIGSAPEYSSVKVIRLSSTKNLLVYPNPAKDKIYVSGPNLNNILSIRLLNNQGQVLQVIKTGFDNSILSLDVGNYAAGNYLLQIVSNDGRTQTNSVLVEH